MLNQAYKLLLFACSLTVLFGCLLVKTQDTQPYTESSYISTSTNDLMAIRIPKPDHATAHPHTNPFYTANNNNSAIHIYQRRNQQWQFESCIKAPAETLEFGRAIEITQHNTLIIAALNKVFIYQRKQNSSWALQQTLTGNNSDDFGSSLAASNNGKTLMVGAPKHSNTPNTADKTIQSGAVYFFSLINNHWQHVSLITSQHPKHGDSFGSDVAISHDGQRIAVTAPLKDSGAAYVFDRSNNTWQQTAYLKSKAPHSAQLFGSAVNINSTGSVMAISTSTKKPWQQTLIYQQHNNQWALVQVLGSDAADSL